LPATNDAGNCPQHASFVTGGAFRALPKVIPIPKAIPKDDLPFPLIDSSIHPGFAQLVGYFIYEEATGEVIRAINPDVGGSAYGAKEGFIGPALVGLNGEVGTEVLEVVSKNVDFGLAKVLRGIEGLAVKVFQSDGVGIAKNEPPNPHRTQIQGGGGAQTSHANYQRRSSLKAPLVPKRKKPLRPIRIKSHLDLRLW
jgi:hypothetical protein